MSKYKDTTITDTLEFFNGVVEEYRKSQFSVIKNEELSEKEELSRNGKLFNQCNQFQCDFIKIVHNLKTESIKDQS